MKNCKNISVKYLTKSIISENKLRTYPTKQHFIMLKLLMIRQISEINQHSISKLGEKSHYTWKVTSLANKIWE
jgi:hypothetical protein